MLATTTKLVTHKFYLRHNDAQQEKKVGDPWVQSFISVQLNGALKQTKTGQHCLSNVTLVG